ncbi:hypothetical protein Pmar_PMAR002388, partial [Perkinsus marinus ATCC 50983]
QSISDYRLLESREPPN